MANLTNQLGFVTNPQFSGGEAVTPLSGSSFAYENRGYGGIYVGTPGTLVVKTINGNVITLVSASGFIPGLIGAVSSSSTAADIIGFDPIPVALPTTTTSTSTTSTSTTAAPTTTSTTTAAPATTTSTTAAPASVEFTLYSGSYTGSPGSATITGAGSVCYNSIGPGFPGPTSVTLYVPSGTLWGTAGSASIQAYTDSGLTTLYTGGAEADFTAWGTPSSTPFSAGGGVIRFFNLTTDGFESAQVC
jgi:hypothetical protein